MMYNRPNIVPGVDSRVPELSARTTNVSGFMRNSIQSNYFPAYDVANNSSYREAGTGSLALLDHNPQTPIQRNATTRDSFIQETSMKPDSLYSTERRYDIYYGNRLIDGNLYAGPSRVGTNAKGYKILNKNSTGPGHAISSSYDISKYPTKSNKDLNVTMSSIVYPVSVPVEEFREDLDIGDEYELKRLLDMKLEAKKLKRAIKIATKQVDRLEESRNAILAKKSNVCNLKSNLREFKKYEMDTFWRSALDELCSGIGSLSLALCKIINYTGKSALNACSSITDQSVIDCNNTQSKRRVQPRKKKIQGVNVPIQIIYDDASSLDNNSLDNTSVYSDSSCNLSKYINDDGGEVLYEYWKPLREIDPYYDNCELDKLPEYNSIVKCNNELNNLLHPTHIKVGSNIQRGISISVSETNRPNSTTISKNESTKQGLLSKPVLSCKNVSTNDNFSKFNPVVNNQKTIVPNTKGSKNLIHSSSSGSDATINGSSLNLPASRTDDTGENSDAGSSSIGSTYERTPEISSGNRGGVKSSAACINESNDQELARQISVSSSSLNLSDKDNVKMVERKVVAEKVDPEQDVTVNKINRKLSVIENLITDNKASTSSDDYTDLEDVNNAIDAKMKRKKSFFFSKSWTKGKEHKKEMD